MKKIGVIGAGITGISTCHFLEKKLASAGDFQIKLIDKGEEPGGVISTVQKEGFVIDAGPDCFISTKPAPIHLAEELGFDNHLVNTRKENKGTYIYADGKLHKMPEGLMMMVPTKFWPFVTTGLFSFSGKIRMGMDLFIPKKKNNYDESLASFVRRRLGEEALDKLAEPLVAGIHGSNPDTMSLRATFPRFLDMEEKYGSLIKGFVNSRNKFKKKTGQSGKSKNKGKNKRSFFVSFKYGMQELTDKLVESLKKTEIETQREVKKISIEDSGFRVEFKDGESEYFDLVVVTVPADVAGEILPEQLNKAKDLLSEIPYSSSATISFAFDGEKINKTLKGFGFVVASSAGKNILAGTWSSRKWPNRAPEGKLLVRTFLGGANKSQMLEKEEDVLVDMALNDLRTITGITADPDFYLISKMYNSMPQYVLGHRKRVEGINKEIKKINGLSLAGSYFVGVGIGDCIKQGEKASEEVVDFLLK